MAKSSNVRRSNGALRTKLRNRIRALGLPCALCGKPIDYSLPAGHPMAYELDEIVPVSRGGNPFDPDNVQPAHRICNQRKGDGRKPSGKARRARMAVDGVGEVGDWKS